MHVKAYGKDLWSVVCVCVVCVCVVCVCVCAYSAVLSVSYQKTLPYHLTHPLRFSLNSILILSSQHAALSFGGNIIRVIKSNRESCAEPVARKGKVKAPADINRDILRKKT